MWSRRKKIVVGTAAAIGAGLLWFNYPRPTADMLRDAAAEGNVWAVRIMLARGVNPNAVDPWHEDCTCDDYPGTPVSQFLIAHGADVNVSCGDGDTALMDAAEAGDTDYVKLLLSRGARVDLMNKDGETALSIAETYDQLVVVSILQSAGAKEPTAK